MREFDLIELIRDRVGETPGDVRLGIGDDAAVLGAPADQDLVVTTDTLNAGIHFFEDADPADIGHKALAVCLSDLAAMGAVPRWALLSLSMPQGDAEFMRAFMSGFGALADTHGVTLVGGDTCHGPLSVTVTAIGFVGPGRALNRQGANAGDLVVVSGCPGQAAAALARIRGGGKPDPAALAALARPVPRVALGAALVGKASACIDISDGLLADLTHVVTASGCGATLELGELPQCAAFAEFSQEERWQVQLAGGDDYELCFTCAPGQVAQLPAMAQTTGVALRVIGRIEREPGTRCLDPGGREFAPARRGYEHFE